MMKKFLFIRYDLWSFSLILFGVFLGMMFTLLERGKTLISLIHCCDWFFGIGLIAILSGAWIILKRKPSHKKDIQALLCHAGVLIILAGAIASRWLSLHGEVDLCEGQTASAIKTDKTSMEYPLAFRIQLQSFEIDYYPGTDQPMEYRSRVRLLNEKNRVDREAVISMNHPLRYQGFRIYQSGYRKSPGGKLVQSVLTFNQDPGALLIYVGAVLLLIGLFGVFFLTNHARIKMIFILIFWSSVWMVMEGYSDEKLDYSRIESIPIQHRGRIKPLQSFADETIQFVTGHKNFKGIPSIELLLSSLFDAENFLKQPIIYIPHANIKEDLQLDSARSYFSLEELKNIRVLEHHRFESLLINEIQLNQNQKDWIRLSGQIGAIHECLTGRGIRIIPREGQWLSLADLELENKKDPLVRLWKDLGRSFCDRAALSFRNNSEELDRILSEQSGFLPKVFAENISRRMNFFQKAQWMYGLAFFLMLIMRRTRLKGICWLIFIMAFVFHTAGLVFRGYISGRIPVSNMYESLLFTAWGISFFSMGKMLYRGNQVNAVISSLLSFLILWIASSDFFDSGIDPLMPVLRSHFWLSFHVLSILLGYSGLTLAMGFAHVLIGIYIFSPKKVERLRIVSNLLQKNLEVGLFFLVLGTFLGGVWADQAWGRFWGWDPKETSALMTMVVYFIIFHLFWRKRIQDFGLAVFSILGFFLILMTYYGVNFIVAKGLHHYGFGSGGTFYIWIFIWAEIVFVSVCAFERSIRLKKEKSGSHDAQ